MDSRPVLRNKLDFRGAHRFGPMHGSLIARRGTAVDLSLQLRGKLDLSGATLLGPVVPPPSPDSELRLALCDKQPLECDHGLPILHALKSLGFGQDVFKQFTFDKFRHSFELGTASTPQGLAAKLDLLGRQRIEVELTASRKALLQVSSIPGPLAADVQVVQINDVPINFRKEGFFAALLTGCGYDPSTFSVLAEGVGQHNATLRSVFSELGNGRVTMAYVKTPRGDHQLAKLPAFLVLDGSSCRLTRNFREPEWVPLTTSPNPRSSGCRPPPPAASPSGAPLSFSIPSAPPQPLKGSTAEAAAVSSPSPTTGSSLLVRESVVEPQTAADSSPAASSASAIAATPPRHAKTAATLQPAAGTPTPAQPEQDLTAEPSEATAEEAPFVIPKSHQKAAKRAARRLPDSPPPPAPPPAELQRKGAPTLKLRQLASNPKPASKPPSESAVTAKQQPTGKEGAGTRAPSRSVPSVQPAEPKSPLKPNGRPRRANAGKGGWQTKGEFGGVAAKAAASPKQA